MQSPTEPGALHLADVEPERRASVALDGVTSARRQWQREHRRPSALTAREALAAVQFECLLIWVAIGNFINGVELTTEDFERLTLAMRRIDALVGEVQP